MCEYDSYPARSKNIAGGQIKQVDKSDGNVGPQTRNFLLGSCWNKRECFA